MKQQTKSNTEYSIQNVSFQRMLASVFCILYSVLCFSQNLNITLAAQLSYGSQGLANTWGWKSPVDGKEYALVGAQNGLSIVDVSNPSIPIQIIQIPGPPSIWREVKTVGNYAYITTENGKIGLQIVELTNLPSTNLAVTTWKPKIGIDSLETIHALHADNGKVYLYGSNVGNGGCIIADVTTNPMAPIYLGRYDPRYVHDGYVRNDTMYAGHISAGECAIVDASNPSSPNVLATFQTPGAYTHNTWLSADSKICFTTDEVSNSFLAAFDISNLSNIFELDRIQSNPGSNSVVHNTHIINVGGNDYAVTSWYNDGFTIVDAGRPGNLVQVGNYDTAPTSSGSGMSHDWGVYPFFPSGTIVASDESNGLFVCSPTYARACYLEGVVTNCITGNPLSGVNVTLQVLNPQSSSTTDITDFQGQYAVGIAAPDTYMVVCSKIGYYTDTDTVILSTGVVTLDSFQLCPLPTFAYSGFIFYTSTTAGIPNASVSIYDANLRWDTITNASGNFSIPTMFSGTYTIAAGKWGYVTKCIGGQNISPAATPISMGLDKGIYDDFIWDFGWTVSGNATSGIWERGEPLGTTDGYGSPINPDFDIATDCGVDAYITGNQGVSASDDDVDSGSAILTSPVFDISAYTAPYIFYSRWERLSWNSNDTVIIKISNGTTTATLESITAAASGQATWVNRNYKISNFLTPTSTMTFIMQVADLGAGNVNEGALDQFYIMDSINSGVNEIANIVDVSIYPNPFSATAILRITNGKATKYELKLYDMYGKEVRNESIRNADSFVISRGNLAGGIYFYQLLSSSQDGPGEVIATGKLCVE